MKSLPSQDAVMQYDIFDKKFRPLKGHKRSDIYTGKGSSFEIKTGKCEDVLLELKDNSVHTIITDPPYAVSINKDWDKALPKVEVWNECYRILKPGSHLAFFGQPSMMPQIFAIMAQTQFQFRDMIIWCYQGTHPKGYKTDDEAFRSRMRNVYNPIFIYRKKLEGTEEQNWLNHRTNLLNINDTRIAYKGDHTGIVKRFEETGKKHVQSDVASNTFSTLSQKGWIPDARGAIATNVVYCSRPTADERTMMGKVMGNDHETLKPVALMGFLVKLLTNSPEQLCLDLYAGSGTTGIACRKNNIPFIGIEKGPTMADIARERIKYTFDLDEKFFNKLRQV